MKKINNIFLIVLLGVAGNQMIVAMEDPEKEVTMEQMVDEAKKEALEALERGEDPFTSPTFQMLLQMQRSQTREGKIATPTRALKKIHAYTQSIRPITADIKLWLGMYQKIQENAITDNDIHDIIITADGKYFIVVFSDDAHIYNFEDHEITDPIKIIEADFIEVSADGKYIFVQGGESSSEEESEIPVEPVRIYDLEKGDFVSTKNIIDMPDKSTKEAYRVADEPHVLIKANQEKIKLPELRLDDRSLLVITEDEKYFVVCRYPVEDEEAEEDEQELYDANAFVDVYAFDDDQVFKRTEQDGLNLIAELYRHRDNVQAFSQILQSKQEVFDRLPIALRTKIVEKLSEMESFEPPAKKAKIIE